MARTFFPKEYACRKQNFQKACCAKWPLPSGRKFFRIFGGNLLNEIHKIWKTSQSKSSIKVKSWVAFTRTPNHQQKRWEIRIELIHKRHSPIHFPPYLPTLSAHPCKVSSGMLKTTWGEQIKFVFRHPGFRRPSSPGAQHQLPHAGGGFHLSALDFDDNTRSWHIDMDMVIIYIYSVNWIVGFFIFCILCYLFFPSFWQPGGDDDDDEYMPFALLWRQAGGMLSGRENSGSVSLLSAINKRLKGYIV